MAAEQNNTANVSAVNGVKGGYLFSAPLGTALPTTHTPTLNAAFVNLGYIPSDGAPTFSEESNVETQTDINGDSILVTRTSREDSFTVTLCEIKPDVWKEYYGQDNVTVSSDGKTMTALHKGGTLSGRSYVLLLVLKDGRRMCRVVPNGVVTELGEETIGGTDAFGREITINCLNHAELGTIADYVELIAETA